MTSLNFPSSPTNGDTYSLNGVTYYYNSAIGGWLTQRVAASVTLASNTQVLFDDAGTSNGSIGLTYNKYSNTLSADIIHVNNLTLGGTNTYNWINASFNTANAAYANANTKVTTGKSIAMAIVFS